MATQDVILHPASVIAELKKNNISHVVWLPDSETNFMYQMLQAEPTIDLVPVCREGETMAIAAGLWVGGKKPVVLIQNTGIFESGDSIRGLGLDINQPLVMLIGYRGWTRRGATPDSAARFTEHILHAWGINYYLIETDDGWAVRMWRLHMENVENKNKNDIEFYSCSLQCIFSCIQMQF